MTYAYRRPSTDHPDWAHLTPRDRLRLRFLSYVSLPSGIFGCWVWRGDALRYGKFTMDDGKPWKASRAAYQLFVGTIPPGADILHLCDCPGCVCPWHLRPGSDTDNVSDRQRRGRSRGRNSVSPPVSTEPLSDWGFLEKHITDPAKILALLDQIQAVLRTSIES